MRVVLRFLDHRIKGYQTTLGSISPLDITSITNSHGQVQVSSTGHSSTTIPLTWTAAVAGAQAPSGYLIKASTGAITDPVDGIQPADDTDATDGEGVKSVTPGSAASFAGFTSSPGTSYNFKIYSYTNSGATIDYKTDSAPSVTASTVADPPTLTAAVGATVDAPFHVTFTYDPTWRAAITGITIGGTPLTAGYAVSAGQITFTPSASSPANLLQTSGTKNIAIQATGYGDAAVSQSVGHGTVASYVFGTFSSPYSTGVASIVSASGRDQYSNSCSTDSTTVVTLTSASGKCSVRRKSGQHLRRQRPRPSPAASFEFLIRNNVAETTTITATADNTATGTSPNITERRYPVVGLFPLEGDRQLGDASTWESSHDDLTWFNATLAPTTASTAVTIRNGHNVTVATTPTSTDDTTVDAGGTLTVNSAVTLTIANGPPPT
ncbi:MAG: DUF1533 domain-containing protein [Acidobacteria bacterium]|nr:DUF1533 domain-containing protein [Acidobacteriota bacterium]